MIQQTLKLDTENFKTTAIVAIPNSEIRIIYNLNSRVYIRLTSGKAEMLGAELTSKPYLLPSHLLSIYVFTFHGCEIELIYHKNIKNIRYYVHPDEDNFNMGLAMINGILEKHRHTALDSFKTGPRVVITGGACTGKSSVLKTLINYSVKKEWQPVFVDLDPKLNDLSVPGIISAIQLNEYLPYNAFHLNKLAYFFGHQNIEQKGRLYVNVVETLLEKIRSKHLQSRLDFENFIKNKEFLKLNKNLEQTMKLKKFVNRPVFSSGVFFNLPNELSEFDEPTLKRLFDLINADYIFVIDNDYLKSKLDHLLRNSTAVVRIRRNTGVQMLTAEQTQYLCSLQNKNYFYSDWLVCVREEIDIKSINLYKIDDGSLTLRYVNDDRSDELMLNKVDPQITDLKGNIIAVININSKEVKTYKDILKKEVLFLILITDVNNRQITVMRPKNVIPDYKELVFYIGSVKL